jgi:hypothetical protein
MKLNLAVSIYVRSSIKFLHFVPFHQQIWPPRAILVSDWLLFKKIFSSETAWLLTLANQKKKLILAAMFVGRMEPNEEAL